jgi:hypothetical protein
MTIKDLPTLDAIQAHFINSSPLDSKFCDFVQSTDFYKETRLGRPAFYWKMPENRIANSLKFNKTSPFFIRDDAREKYGNDAINNASRHFTHLLKRNDIPFSLHCAIISWYVQEMIDIEKTIEYNKWEK